MSAVMKNYAAGSFIFREGSPSRSLFVIKKGTVGIRKMKGQGWVDIAKVYPNEVLGELSFFDRQPRSAAAIALTDVNALEIPFNNLDKIYKRIPDYFKTMFTSICERLRKADDTIRRLQTHLVDEADGVIGKAPTKEEEDKKKDAAAKMLDEVQQGLQGGGKIPEDVNLDAAMEEKIRKELDEMEKEESSD